MGHAAELQAAAERVSGSARGGGGPGANGDGADEERQARPGQPVSVQWQRPDAHV